MFDVVHEGVGRDRGVLEVGVPVTWAWRQDHLFALFANEYLVGGELVFLGQPDSLTAVGHEDFGGARHDQAPPGMLAIYHSISHITLLECAERASQRLTHNPGMAAAICRRRPDEKFRPSVMACEVTPAP